MNLTVPREHLFEQSDGTLWFVVEGESTRLDGFAAGLSGAQYTGSTGRPFPPDEIVALAAPCETCGDSRRVEMAGLGGLLGMSECPYCADRTLTIRTECKRNKVWCEQFDEHCLADNCDNGTVSLGPFRIETPVPIVAAYSEPDGGQDRVRVYDNGTATLLSGRTWKPWDLSDIDLGSDPARFVGWYAVKAVTA